MFINTIYIISNSLLLFILVQFFGKAVSNLLKGSTVYDLFLFSRQEDKSFGRNIIFVSVFSAAYICILAEANRELFGEQFDRLTIWVVVVFLLLRFFVIIFFLNRTRLMNFSYNFSLCLFTLLTSFVAYKLIIEPGISIFIPVEDFKNEILLLLLLFIYDCIKRKLDSVYTYNKVYPNNNVENYLLHKKRKFQKQFGQLIDSKIAEDVDFYKNLIYSIMIYENYVRPPFARGLERILSRYSSNKMSTGVMQVCCKQTLNDYESVEKGIDILNSYFSEALEDRGGVAIDVDFWESIIIQYNDSYEYMEEVMEIAKILQNKEVD